MRRITYILLLVSSIIHSQNHTKICDSLLKEAEWVVSQSKITNLNLNEDLLEKLFKHSQQHNCPTIKPYAFYTQLSDNYLKNGNIEDAILLNRKYEALIKSKKPQKLNEVEISLQLKKAEINTLLGKNEESIGILMNLISRINHEFPNYVGFSKIYSNIGNNYIELYNLKNKKNHIDSAQNYFNMFFFNALREKRISKEKLAFQYSINKIALLKTEKKYAEICKLGKDILFINEGDTVNRDEKNHLILLIAEAFYNQNKIDSCVRYCNKLNKYPDLTKIERINLYNLLYKSYTKLNRNDSVLKYSKLSYNEFTSYDNYKQTSLNLLHKIDLNEMELKNNELNKNIINKALRIGILITFFIILLILIIYRLNNQKTKISKDYKKYYNRFNELYTEKNNQSPTLQLSKEKIKEIKKKLTLMEESGEFLNKNCSLNLMAKKLDTNTAYLSFYFNHIKKQSFPNYLNHLRINYIIEQLHTNPKLLNYSIEGLALECGFNDASVFSKTFKSIVNIPPSYYLQELKKQKKP